MTIWKKESVIKEIFGIKPDEKVVFDLLIDKSNGNVERYIIIKAEGKEKIILPICFDKPDTQLPVAIWEAIRYKIRNCYEIGHKGWLGSDGEIRNIENEIETEEICQWDGNIIKDQEEDMEEIWALPDIRKVMLNVPYNVSVEEAQKCINDSFIRLLSEDCSEKKTNNTKRKN